MTWVIGDTENGWYIPAGDADALAQKLIDLQQHPEQLTEAGQRARTRFDQGFSAQHCVEQTIAVYKQCIRQ
jgi:glycosyltransferase involved in cell wall biosynthesis